MAKTSIKKPGYKHTELGWIPEEWEVNSVGDAYCICNNLRFPISEEIRRTIKGKYPYYGPTKIQDFINEYRIEGKFALIGEDGDHFLKWKELPMTLLVEGKFNVNNHAHLLKGVDNLTEWFYYFFKHRELTPYLTRQGAGRYKLTKEALSGIPILIPSLSEQRRISTILSTWDKAISEQQQLIDTLQARHRALMQQLLTGKKRLKGFKEEWSEVMVGDFLSESRLPSIGNNLQKRLTVRLGIRGVEKRDVRGTEMENATAFYQRRSGQFIYGKQNLHKGAFGIIPEDLDGYESSQDIPTFDIDKSIDANFFLYYLSQENVYTTLENISTGTGSKRIQPKDFFRITFQWPLLKEQSAIANILSTSEKEIQIHRRRLATLQEQKKGLMQVLLTGKVRVKV